MDISVAKKKNGSLSLVINGLTKGQLNSLQMALIHYVAYVRASADLDPPCEDIRACFEEANLLESNTPVLSMDKTKEMFLELLGKPQH